MKKRVIAWLLTLAMLCGLLPMAVFADENSEEAASNTICEQSYYINPLYADQITEEDLIQPKEPEASDIALLEEDIWYPDTAAAAQALREGLKARNETIRICCQTTDKNYHLLGDIFMEEALCHTGTPTEGDYLRWQVSGSRWTIKGSYTDGVYYMAFTYTVTYYTTAEQEAELDRAVSALLAELNVSNAADYEKVQAVYSYITGNVSYDYTNLKDDNYTLKYTAYAALVNKTAVCQGYSCLLYRLLLELGVDCRLITGDAGEAHAWSIIRLDELYYYADATWDASIYPQTGKTIYFLKGAGSYFDEGSSEQISVPLTDGSGAMLTKPIAHVADDEYRSAAFAAAYPMATADYVSETVHTHVYTATVTAPTCTEQGYTTHTCSCGDSFTDSETAALGHDAQYSDNGDGTHTINCSRCDYSVSEAHCYTAGRCICGKADPVTVEGPLKNPVRTDDSTMASGQCTTWDCVWLGTYPQAEIVSSESMMTQAIAKDYLSDDDYVVDKTLYSQLQSSENWDDSNDLTLDDVRYHRMQRADAVNSKTSDSYYSWADDTTWHYFRYDPIKWRVLSTDGSTALLLADVCLDDVLWNSGTAYGNQWSASEVRSWLNGCDGACNTAGTDYSGSSFLRSAFTAEGLSAIVNGTVRNNTTNVFTDGSGTTTTDRIFLLSRAECLNAEYGFQRSENSYDEARWCKASTYAKARGVWWNTNSSYPGNCCWWLRSAGAQGTYACDIDSDGKAFVDRGINSRDYGIRPALRLELSNTCWSYAGTVGSDGSEAEQGRPHKHSYTATITTEASCTEDGIRTYTCSICGGSYTEAITALGHDNTATVTLPTCAKRGYTTYTCSRCGNSYKDQYVKALGHSYAASVTQAPTCTEAGIMTYICSTCGNTYAEEIPASGHSCTDTVTAPTCTKKGYTTHVCSVCDTSYKDSYTAAAGHSFGDWEVLAAATCTGAGSKKHTCTICGFVETKKISAAGHYWNADYTVDQAPTCTENGSKSIHCANCDAVKAITNIKALGHSFKKYTSNKDASCTTDGTKTAKCSRCGVTNTVADTGSATGHSFTDTVTPPTCTEAGYTTHVCSVCGFSCTDTEIAALRHRYTGETTTEPTITKPGTKTYTCSECGDFYTEELPALGCPFTDVAPGQYYYNPVLWAVENKITSGTSATTFSPNETCTRAQVVAFLWRAAGRPEPVSTDNPFTDVTEGQYFYKAVLWAVENKITSGTTKTTFSPNDPCTRAQVVAFQWRAAGRPEPTTAVNPFADVTSDKYYYKAVLWAVEAGITKGTSKTTFSPNDACTRGQIVTFLYKQYK